MKDIIYVLAGVLVGVIIAFVNVKVYGKESVVEKPQVVQEVKPEVQKHTKVIFSETGREVKVFDVKSPSGKNCVVAVGFQSTAMHCY